MATAQFRFYEELNDFLPRAWRKREFPHALPPGATVKHAVEGLGVPHTEVEIVLVDGESVGFDRVVRSGDRVSVYPAFETFDVTPLLRLRARALRATRFLADAHLGALARDLRMLGFDTRVAPAASDREVATATVREGRILLTRDRALLMRSELTHACYLHEKTARRQLREIVRRLDLARSARPFTRCMACNAVLEPVARESVAHRVPPRVAREHADLRRCPDCGRVYWPGSHHARMRRRVEADLAEAGAATEARR